MNLPSKFFKFQSLGNDFIIFDLLEVSKVDFEKFIKSLECKERVRFLCDRHFGVGADGVLFISPSYKRNIFTPQINIFNSDGSKAELCLNGLRCVGKYLYKFHNFSNEFDLFMGGNLIRLSISSDNDKITMIIDSEANVIKKDIEIYSCGQTLGFTSDKVCDISKEQWAVVSGHFVDIGNPHFVVLKHIVKELLFINGPLLEKHPSFPYGTNVEFVWEIESRDGIRTFEILVYERGCGITLSCSSGAVSVLKVLYHLGMISRDEQINLKMLGGRLKGCICNDNTIVLSAGADMIFEGILN